jgi:DinB superfamily
MPLSLSALTRLQHQHQTLRELIGDRTEAQLKQIVVPGKWSAFDNIAHLACYQPIFLQRLDRIETEDTPAFERYIAEQDPSFPGYQQRSLPQLLSSIDAQRSTILAKLQGLSENTLQRKGRHPRYGLLTVNQWTDFFLLHEAHHLYTIFMLIL